MSKYDFGGLEKHPVNILRLISELEGSSQLCKYMGFEDDMNTINEMLSDSDLINVQQKYQNIFWSILAIGTFVFTIANIKK